MIDVNKEDVNSIFDTGKPLTEEERDAQTKEEDKPIIEDELEPSSSETHETEDVKGDVDKVADLQEEKDNLHKALTKSRGESKVAIAELKRRLTETEKQLTEMSQSQADSEISTLLDQYQPDDAITVEGARKLLAIQAKKQQADVGRMSAQTMGTIAELSQVVFKQSHKDYDETVAPFLDRFQDPGFAKLMYSEGPLSVPEKLYTYAKAQASPGDLEAKIVKKVTDGLKQLQKPKTMTRQSQPQGNKTNLQNMTLEQKRKAIKAGKLSQDALNESWIDALDNEK